MKSQPRYRLDELRKQQYEYHRTKCKYSTDWNWHSPYTYLKSRFYMEGAALIVFILQYTPIRPNTITITYGILGILGGILLAFPNTILIGALIFFTKGTIDLADGHLARITNNVSEVGGRLDYYAGRIGTKAFYIGIICYTLNTINIPLAIILLLFIIFGKLDGRARTIDFILFVVGVQLLLLDKLFNIVYNCS